MGRVPPERAEEFERVRTSLRKVDPLLARLKDDPLDIVARLIDDCESPIEALFATTTVVVWLYTANAVEVVHPDGEAEGFGSPVHARDTLTFWPQVQFETARHDFMLGLYDSAHPHPPPDPRTGEPAPLAVLIVECDGHDFHERTKDQAARDRSRDRALQARGATIFRFTGRELYRNPYGCARETVMHLAELAERVR